MSADRRDLLLLLVAELADERGRVARLLSELEHAAQRLREPDTESLVMYGVAALLDSFYTGMERALARIAATIGGQPSGSESARRVAHGDDAARPGAQARRAHPSHRRVARS